MLVLYEAEGLIQPFIGKGAIAATADFNDILNYGIYSIYTSTENNTNAPSAEIAYGLILCYGHSEESERIVQVVIDANNGKIYTRWKYNVWYNWKTV